MSRALAWVTGAAGLIGGCLVRAAPRFAPAWDAAGLTRAELDLGDFAAVRAAFREQKPELVIHCAALSKSPECQARPELARRLNVDVTALLAELSADGPFVFFSTDLVFDGRKGNYVEGETENPLNVYAETKLAAEKVVLRNPRHTVIRTSLNGGATPAGDRAFNEQLRRAWREGQRPMLFTDEFRCPMHASVTARAVWELIARGATGLFHVAGSERLSRWDIGRLIAARCPELHPEMVAGSLRDWKGAPRPPDTSLHCAKAQAILSFPLPRLSEWLAAHPGEYF
jgi:dTDP-4-dehydrorhamnose reductase